MQEKRKDPASIRKAIVEKGLLPTNKPIVALLSGGRDSVCLLHVVTTIIGPERTSALHVNYQLRVQADEDEAACAELCRQLGVKFVAIKAGKPDKGNLQDWARKLRYREAEKLAAQLDAKIAAGHTATDQVETILYRLATSPGRRALLGMKPQHGNLIRPLLDLTRQETAQYCRDVGISWSEDDTNALDTYARNRIRNQVLPVLTSIHPSAAENILASIDLFRAEADVLSQLAGQWISNGEVDLDGLRQAPTAIQRLVLIELAESEIGRPVPGIAGKLDKLFELAQTGGSKEIDLGQGAKGVVEYGKLQVTTTSQSDRSAPQAVTLAVPGEVRFGAFSVSCQPTEDRHGIGIIDAEAITEPLTVRAWQTGDRIKPIGTQGSKSLQDLFTDRKVPRRIRRQLPVVESDGKIVWVANIATSAEFAITKKTTRAFALNAQSHANLLH